MDLQNREPKVLARIPDLSVAGGEGTPGSLPLSSGRVIGQALSFKLLAGAALALVALAVIPFVLNRGGPPANPATADEPQTAWQLSPPAPSAEAAPPWKASVAAEGPASAQPSPLPGVMPNAEAAGRCATPTSTAAADAALSSAWPNPAYPISSPEAASEEPSAGVNQAMAIRPSEYLRNRYDSTRSGVH